MIYVLCVLGGMGLGIIIGVLVGIKIKQHFYGFMLDEWRNQCEKIQYHNHENLILLINTFDDFYEKYKASITQNEYSDNWRKNRRNK